MKTLGHQQVWGHAKDLLDSAKKIPSDYDVGRYPTDGIPAPGDVIVWDGSTPYEGHGHTAVVISADANTVTVLEQNVPGRGNPTGLPQTHTYPNYDHVTGWIHPKQPL